MRNQNILDKDRTGKCTEGECRDRVREVEEELQSKLEESGVEAPDDYPEVKRAKSRNDPPGFYGGHA